MKTNSLLMLCLVMCLSVSLSAQKSKLKNANTLKNSLTEVYSITLKSDFEKLTSKYDLSQYFDYSGKELKAQKGYKLTYSKNDKAFILTTSKYDVNEGDISKITKQDGSVEIPGVGTFKCGGCQTVSSCNPGTFPTGSGTSTLACGNPCGECSASFIAKQREVAQFQTPDGGFGF